MFGSFLSKIYCLVNMSFPITILTKNEYKQKIILLNDLLNFNISIMISKMHKMNDSKFVARLQTINRIENELNVLCENDPNYVVCLFKLDEHEFAAIM